MIRKFNYTGRRRIKKEDVDIHLTGQKNNRRFEAKLNLKDYNLPENSKVYIEPYFRQSSLRFDCGSVKEISIPRDTEIQELPYSNNIFFRVKIVDERGKNGLILALADKIKPTSREDGEDFSKKSLLPVEFGADLGRQVWKISFTSLGPILYINSKISTGRELVVKDEFISLVYPNIIREIFKEICVEFPEYEESEDDWVGLWLKYSSKELLAPEKPKGDFSENKEELTEWIDNVVEKFCQRNFIYNRFEATNL